MFFVFDGVDGGGKSTQLVKFANWIESLGFDVVTCKDPGSTELGEALRELLLNSTDLPIHMRSEMMMFTTARTQLVEQVVRPALAAGKVVILDRYIFSTVVYQGHAGDLDAGMIWEVNQFATNGLLPDATFILDLPVELAIERLGENLDRMESRGTEYFEKVRAGFLKVANENENVHVVDASKGVDQIEEQVREFAERVIDSSQGSSRKGQL